jgi:hypothetical protein
VAEVNGAKVGTGLGQHSAGQCEVVVLDKHGGAGARLFRDRLCEEQVELAVGVPGLHPVAIEAGSAGQIEEVVVAEPQGGVGDDVVSHPVDVGIGFQRDDVQAVFGHEALGRGKPVGLAHRGGHPSRPSTGQQRMERPG